MKKLAPLLVALIAAGCSEGPTMMFADTDSGSAGAVDAARVEEDGGMVDPLRDAGVDAGSLVPADSGGPLSDAGAAEDAGHDSGTIDAGTDAGVVDAGPPSPVVQVAAGETHTCALRGDGTVWCWGSPGAALGYGGTGGWPFPRQVSGLSDAVGIAAGGTHTCAARVSGEVSCWGRNDQGQAGTGSVSTWQLTPGAVGGVTEAVQVALGTEHSCALNSGLSVDMGQCWGRNQHGQLGNPSAGDRETSPVWVDGFNDGVELSARGSRTCVRRPDQSIWCWGLTSTFAREPVTGLGVAVGRRHTCTLRPGPPRVRPACWGDNTYGQTTTITATWTVGGEQVVAGDHHTCARFDDSSVWCWGRNHRGQLGTGVSADMDGVPQMVLTGVSDVSAGAAHTCAVVEGAVQCWGDASGGQLGNGMLSGEERYPVAVGF